jgi:hypothetical protein
MSEGTDRIQENPSPGGGEGGDQNRSLGSLVLNLPARVVVVGGVLTLMMALPEEEVLSCALVVLLVCAVQDLVIASTGWIWDRSGGTNISKMPVPYRLLPWSRLAVLAALCLWVAVTHVPGILAVYPVVWYVTHSFAKGAKHSGFNEGPSYLRQLTEMLLAPLFDEATPKIVKKWKGTLWLVVAIVVLSSGFSAPRFYGDRRVVLHATLTVLSGGRISGLTGSTTNGVQPKFVVEPSSASTRGSSDAIAISVMQQDCGNSGLTWNAQNALELEGPDAEAWYEVGKPILGCTTGDGIVTQQIVELPLARGSSGPAAIVGMFATLNSEVVFSSQMPLLQQLVKAGTLASVGQRLSTGLGDYQLFQLTNGSCNVSMWPTYEASTINLSASATVIVPTEADKLNSIVDQLDVVEQSPVVTVMNVRFRAPATDAVTHMVLVESRAGSELKSADGHVVAKALNADSPCPQQAWFQYGLIATLESKSLD